MPKWNRAIIYLRASTNEELQKNSFGTQELAIKRFCKQNSYSIRKTYSEYVSASNGNARPQWNRCVQRLKDDPELTLVAYELTRISRDLKDWVTLEPLLPQIRFTEMSDAKPSFLNVSLRLVLAEYESKKLGERIKDGIHRRKTAHITLGRQWTWGNAHNISPEDRKSGPKANREKANEHQNIVRAAIRPVSHKNLADQVKYLNDETDIRTRRGKLWTISNLHRTINR